MHFWQNSIGEKSHLAIETSGHGALKENHWLDDGAFLMVDFICNISLVFLLAVCHWPKPIYIERIAPMVLVVNWKLWPYLQVKILNKLASARASGVGGGSKVLTDLVQGLKEPAVAVELRLKINQNHPELKGGYATVYDFCKLYSLCMFCEITNKFNCPDLSGTMERQCWSTWRTLLNQTQSFKKPLLTMKG